MEDLKSKLIAAIKTAIQPDIDKWVAPDDNHVVTFDITPIGALWSFRDLGVTPTECNTISVIREGEYFRIKYDTRTKYIITKHGDVFLIGYNHISHIVTVSAISRALYTAFSNPDPTDCILRNKLFVAIRDWVKTHMPDANWQTNGIEFGITKAGFRLSTIDIKSAVNNPLARCVRINESILAIWSGNEWISNDPIKGNVCTRGLSVHEVGCLRDVIINIKPEQKPESNDKLQTALSTLGLKLIPEEQKPDSTDEQLLKSSNAKSFDELFEQLSSESIKHVPIPTTMLQNDQNTMTTNDMYKQIIDDLKSLVNATGQPVITAIQKPNRNHQMMHRIKPIVTKWLKDIVYSAGPFSSFEEVSESPDSLKYSFILHGERDANISMEIPNGFIGTMFISHDGVRIMRIGPDDVVLLFPFNNLDPDIQINRLHLSLYDVLNVKQKRSKIDELVKCITLFIRVCYPDIQYSIVCKHINIIKRSDAPDAPVGSIRLGFSYEPGYQLCIWHDNDYDHPFIEIDDKWKPFLYITHDEFAYKMCSWLIANFGREEEDPMIIPDSLAKSLCRSDKVVPFRFTPMTHNFKSWASIGFAEAANLKTVPEGAGVYMDIAMQLVKERNNMIKIPGIKNVLFNDTKHTTTVLFEDGTITMSKTTDGETYDHEVGFAMCIMKKIYGNRTRFQKEIKKWTSVCENANKKIADKAAKKQEKNEEEVES